MGEMRLRSDVASLFFFFFFRSMDRLHKGSFKHGDWALLIRAEVCMKPCSFGRIVQQLNWLCAKIPNAIFVALW